MDAPRVDPNVARQLGVGESFVIAHGRAARVQVAPVEVNEQAGWHAAQIGGIMPIRDEEVMDLLVHLARHPISPPAHVPPLPFRPARTVEEHGQLPGAKPQAQPTLPTAQEARTEVTPPRPTGAKPVAEAKASTFQLAEDPVTNQSSPETSAHDPEQTDGTPLPTNEEQKRRPF